MLVLATLTIVCTGILLSFILFETLWIACIGLYNLILILEKILNDDFFQLLILPHDTSSTVRKKKTSYKLNSIPFLSKEKSFTFREIWEERKIKIGGHVKLLFSRWKKSWEHMSQIEMRVNSKIESMIKLYAFHAVPKMLYLLNFLLIFSFFFTLLLITYIFSLSTLIHSSAAESIYCII